MKVEINMKNESIAAYISWSHLNVLLQGALDEYKIDDFKKVIFTDVGKDKVKVELLYHCPILNEVGVEFLHTKKLKFTDILKPKSDEENVQKIDISLSANKILNHKQLDLLLVRNFNIEFMGTMSPIFDLNSYAFGFYNFSSEGINHLINLLLIDKDYNRFLKVGSMASILKSLY